MAQKTRIKLVCSDINKINSYVEEVREITDKIGISLKGPITLPTKKLGLKVRKSPDGEGKASFERYQMRVHKRLIEIPANDRALRLIMKIKIPKSLHIEVKLV